MLLSGANLLLLDEPTNDLDVDVLDRIATHILAFEGDSHVKWLEGNFQDYEADKMRRLGTDSVIPHRLKYKKFSR
jgi:ATPase subunit of ABC transporter with duplicated ATPase domains